jgi:hypothetical protein
MGMYVTGVCVGIKDEDIEYTKDGRDQTFRSITASFADASGVGKPVDVDLNETQLQYFKAFDSYSFPVEASVMSTKRGNFCRISIPKSAKIQRTGANGTGAATSAQSAPAK